MLSDGYRGCGQEAEVMEESRTGGCYKASVDKPNCAPIHNSFTIHKTKVTNFKYLGWQEGQLEGDLPFTTRAQRQGVGIE